MTTLRLTEVLIPPGCSNMRKAEEPERMPRKIVAVTRHGNSSRARETADRQRLVRRHMP